MNLDADAVVWTHATTRQSVPSRPLLVLMHGLGSHEHDLVGLLPHLPSHVDAASLRAPLRDMGGFAGSRVGTALAHLMGKPSPKPPRPSCRGLTLRLMRRPL